MGRECAGQYFDRHVTPEPRIAGTVDLAHSACAECAHDFVRPKANTRLQRQWNERRL
jgi:hypothetical protein